MTSFRRTKSAESDLQGLGVVRIGNVSLKLKSVLSPYYGNERLQG